VIVRRFACVVGLGSALAVITPRIGHAAPNAVATVDVSEDIGAGDQAAWTEALAEAIGNGAVAAPAGADPCADAACIEALASAQGANGVVAARVDKSINDYSVSISVHDQSGAKIGTHEFLCEICTAQDVSKRFAEEIGKLDDQIGQLAKAKTVTQPGTPAVVKVSSDPKADVWIDGKRVGKTPLETELAAGAHELKISTDGHAPHVESFEVSDGTRASFSVVLDSLGGDGGGAAGGDSRRKVMFATGLGLIGGGVAGVAGGAVLVAIDSRPIKRKCVGDSVDINGECEFLHDTLIGGAVALGVGGAALVTGVVLTVLARKGQGRSNREQARVRVVPTAQGVGIWF
jgi:hypothetical protein